MIQLRRLHTIEGITAALKRDDLYKGIHSTEEWSNRYIRLQSLYFIIEYKGDDVGLAIFEGEGATSMSYHGGIFKGYRKYTQEIVEGVLESMSGYFPGVTLWTRMKGGNPTKELAENMGCTLFGTLEQEDSNETIYFYRWN